MRKQPQQSRRRIREARRGRDRVSSSGRQKRKVLQTFHPQAMSCKFQATRGRDVDGPPKLGSPPPHCMHHWTRAPVPARDAASSPARDAANAQGRGTVGRGVAQGPESGAESRDRGVDRDGPCKTKGVPGKWGPKTRTYRFFQECGAGLSPPPSTARSARFRPRRQPAFKRSGR